MSENKASESSNRIRRELSSQSAPSSSQKPADAIPARTLFLDFYHIIRDLILFFCRRVIFGPPIFKLFVSFTIIVIGSLLRSFDLAPNSYFSLKTNFFNRYFAKLGWGWTMGLLIPFVYLTLITTHNQYQIITRHLSRLFVATSIWFIVTTLFARFEELTGMCKHEDLRSASRRACVKGGHEWQEGYDLSGHTFLLLYALLIINEEVKSYDKGTKKVDQASSAANAKGDALSEVKHEYLQIISKVIRLNYVALAALTILWEFMLLSTALYFHYTLHKIFAAMIAVFFWYITYYVWYRLENSPLLRPSAPKD
ncbi:unnamed protein product [Adineta ricciae]|uniref:Fat storage-inducing transmembrane protein 2 n=1 Tax=Adineta ricciae TaxID=249248 RepID=A0A815FSS0_ADIRI|nr:unnamed protein product [Adineta ricciae]CAF1330220.1 unnamed protein product [Adineta ricciae]